MVATLWLFSAKTFHGDVPKKVDEIILFWKKVSERYENPKTYQQNWIQLSCYLMEGEFG